MSIDPIPTIPDRIANLARAALWIEYMSMTIESAPTPDDTWFRAVTGYKRVEGEWSFGDIVKAVRSTVEKDGREWTEYDRNLFPTLLR